MDQVVSIYEAKTQLSKLVKRARAGETIYIGAYGRAEAVLAPVPERQPPRIGVWRNRRVIDFAYGSANLVTTDAEIGADIEQGLERDETAR